MHVNYCPECADCAGVPHAILPRLCAKHRSDRRWRRAEWAFMVLAVIGTALISLWGAVWVGHWFWLASNAGLMACMYRSKQWPLFVLFLIYELLTIRGLFVWS